MVVVEDVHWADDASLDALAFWPGGRPAARAAGAHLPRRRRAASTRHCGGCWAGCAPRSRCGSSCAPLSAEAVAGWRGSAAAGLRVHASTGGQPVLRHRAARGRATTGRRASVSHAVLARLARLPEPTRALLELLAVVPARRPSGAAGRVCPDWVGRARGRRGARGASRCRGGGGVSARAGPPRRRGGAAASRAPGTARPCAWRRCSACRRGPGPAGASCRARRGRRHAGRGRARGGAGGGGGRRPPGGDGALPAGAAAGATATPTPQRADLLEAFTVEASTTCQIGEAMRAAERALALREAQARADREWAATCAG